MDSILKTIRKKVLGMPINSENPDEESAFDVDLITNINTAFSTLTQLGAGPKGGFRIHDDTATWHDFIGDREDVDDIIDFVYLKVKLIFDPPSNSSAAEHMKATADELGWRICEAYENYEE